jgi:hypothetical protein
MNRSYSKIRHIQETNLRLEKRLIKEEVEGEDKFSEVIRMDQEFDEDPVYKKYEKVYMRNKIVNMLSQQMGIDASEMEDDEVEDMVEMFSMMMDLSKDDTKSKLTPENIMAHRDGVIAMVQNVKEMADEDGETELSQKITDFIDKLNEL